MASQSDGVLTNLTILVVEDEPIVALDIQQMLEEAGASVIGPAHTVHSAVELLSQAGGTLDVALLDVRMGQETAYPVAAALRSQGIPWVFHTGNADGNILRSDWPGCEVIVKPAPPEQLLAALARIGRH